ncbi:neuropeptide Y receptor type 1 [Exaiptasia diaphana]|uniref:G-protein coupled receptors family 1 profile domain-containing protein n=1 Tax=Exaiptasia diaphana TaxID=2652724 RepID=A0A913XES0_EXADI|nr:neuropeptide Y receptor type 1 [Exaiptasia diaphana]
MIYRQRTDTLTKMEGFNNSLTNHSNNSGHAESIVEIAKRTSFVLVILLGIFGNVFVIILATKYTVRRNLSHLIINMAVSDTLFLVAAFLVPLSWISNKKLTIKSEVFCRCLSFLWHTTVRVSLITLLVISIERFRATKNTLLRARNYTLKQRMTVLGFCWLVPMLFAAFTAYAELSCLEEKTRKSLTPAFLVHEILVVLCCCVIFALGILTTKRLSRLRPNPHLNEEQQKARARRTKAAARMVLTSVFLYSCCCLPLLIFNALYYVQTSIPSVDIIDANIDRASLNFIINGLLLVVNSCFSPLIYIVFLPDFKEAAKKVLFRGRETQNQAPNGENSIEMQPAPNRERTGQNLSQVVANHN